MLEKLERICTDNPRKFWAQMKRLGPRKVNTIPMKVYGINGNITTDIRNISHEWKINFEGLLNRSVDVRFNDEFYYECLHDKNNKENEMESETFASNSKINFPITINEVESFVSKLGDNKATGLDSILNFVLNNQDVIKILYYLFSKLFDECMLPSMWLKSVINPIPKGSNKDPFVPLN